MKTAKPTKNKYQNITVLCGEPMSCQLSLQDIGLSKYDIIHLNDKSSFEKLHSFFNGLSFGEKENIVVARNPSAKLTKKIDKYLEKYTFAIPVYIVLADSYPDLRSSLYSNLNKNGQIKEFSYLPKGEVKTLERYIRAWMDDKPHVKLDGNAIHCIVANAPTRMAQVKTKTGKYENAVYDLIALENELDKIDVHFIDNKSIDLDWLKSCFASYKASDNAWDFVQYAINGDIAKALALMESMSNLQSTLFLVLSQLKFLISLKGAKSHNPNDIMAYMKNNQYLGRYQDEWLSPIENVSTNAVNFYRIQRASQEYAHLSIEQVTKRYHATLYAIQDLRMSVDPDTVMTFYTLALADKVEYSSPMRPIE